MQYGYCEKCGQLSTGRYPSRKCMNVDCKGEDGYAIDELFGELIIRLHSNGIVTSNCCSGHTQLRARSIDTLYMQFKVSADRFDNTFLKRCNEMVPNFPECDYNFELWCNKQTDVTYFNLVLKLKSKEDSKWPTEATERQIYHVSNLYNVLSDPGMMQFLFSLTDEEEKLRYARYKLSKGQIGGHK